MQTIEIEAPSAPAKCPKAPREPLTQARLRELLHYNPETGVFTWLRSGPGRRANLVAGSVEVNHGYVVIRIDYKIHKAHRLAVLWMTGAWPESEVDHENLSRADNRWKNLREATKSQNQANIRGRAVSGIKGAYIHDIRLTRPYRSMIKVDGHKHYLGYFFTAEDAGAAYAAAAVEYFGEFARVS